MHKTLVKRFFFICPTDSLEQPINNSFNDTNFFYTSLGNSFIHNKKTIKQIVEIIEKQDIKEIYFVLSLDNKVVLEALHNNKFSTIKTLNVFTSEIKNQMALTKIVFQKNKLQFSVLSYYLNKKIKELELKLNFLLKKSLPIKGKIYNREQDLFIDIYSKLIYLEKHHLN